ncbi:MAG: hypothetical protein FWG45_02920 [Oscillospiraceae bacterium]|nr:hypothetical protein [Oscillospiraceae bacterium]
MTTKEFEAFTRGIAYQTVLFERGEIDARQYAKSVRMTLGNEAFKQVENIEKELEAK